MTPDCSCWRTGSAPLARGADDPAPVSFAVLALWVSGAGVVLLGLTALAVALLPLPPAGRAVVAVLGLVATVAAMGVASNRITDRAIRAEYGSDPDETGSAPAVPPTPEGDATSPRDDGLG